MGGWACTLVSLHVATSLGLLALVALVYWPGLGGPFIFDDFPAW